MTIEIGKGFQYNIEKPEYKKYAKLVFQLLTNGKLESRTANFLTSGDTANVVTLALLCATTDGPPSYQVVETIGKVYETLDYEVQKSILFALGHEFIITNELDEVRSFESVLERTSKEHAEKHAEKQRLAQQQRPLTERQKKIMEMMNKLRIRK